MSDAPQTHKTIRCPDCGSDALEFREWDNGVDPETGYRDSGEMATCHDCHMENYAEDCRGGEA